MIVSPLGDDKAVDDINSILYREDTVRHQQFLKMDNSVTGGSKVATMTVYQACFNHLSPNVIVKAFKSVKWTYKGAVLIIDYEFDEMYEAHISDAKRWVTHEYE